MAVAVAAMQHVLPEQVRNRLGDRLAPHAHLHMAGVGQRRVAHPAMHHAGLGERVDFALDQRPGSVMRVKMPYPA